MKFATLLKSSTALSMVALLALSACGGGGGDGPETGGMPPGDGDGMMPDDGDGDGMMPGDGDGDGMMPGDGDGDGMMPDDYVYGLERGDAAAVAKVIDLTANYNSEPNVSSWWSVYSFAGEYSTVSLSYRAAAPTHLVVSNDDNGDLQLSVAMFEFSGEEPDLDTPVDVWYRRYADTYEGTRDYTDRVTQLRTEIDDHGLGEGEDDEWTVTALSNDYTHGGTLDVVIATDLEAGATAIDPFQSAEEFAHDIVLDDLDNIIPDGYDFVTVYLKSRLQNSDRFGAAQEHPS